MGFMDVMYGSSRVCVRVCMCVCGFNISRLINTKIISAKKQNIFKISKRIKNITLPFCAQRPSNNKTTNVTNKTCLEGIIPHKIEEFYARIIRLW